MIILLYSLFFIFGGGMLVSHNEWILREELVKLSQHKEWKKAVKEWKLDSIGATGEQKTCLCSHYPIKELCHIFNSKNGNRAIVGNVCVKLFGEKTLYNKTNKIFKGLHRIENNEAASANKRLIKYANEQNFLSDADYEFYIAIWRKRVPSERLTNYKVFLNQRIIAGVSKKEDLVDRTKAMAENLLQIKNDLTEWARPDLIEYAYSEEAIYTNEYEFYKSIWKKDENLSFKQEKWLKEINQRISKRVIIG